MIDSRLFNVVLVLMLTASILGPVLTEHFAPRMLEDVAPVYWALHALGGPLLQLAKAGNTFAFLAQGLR